MILFLALFFLKIKGHFFITWLVIFLKLLSVFSVFFFSIPIELRGFFYQSIYLFFFSVPSRAKSYVPYFGFLLYFLIVLGSFLSINFLVFPPLFLIKIWRFLHKFHITITLSYTLYTCWGLHTRKTVVVIIWACNPLHNPIHTLILVLLL